MADAVALTAEHAESAAPGGLLAVRDALMALGCDPVVVEFSGDPLAWLDAIRGGGFDVVFNLCDGLATVGADEPLPAASIELLGLPMTGARSFTLGLCLRKPLVNAQLRARGIPVPDWAVARAGEPVRWSRYPAIVKPAAEDASLGVDARSVVRDAKQLRAARERGHRSWEHLLVQRFVDGREFNVALVGDTVLPHSEIVFDLPRDRPRVVTYAAKWETGSVDDRGTVPRLLGDREPRLAARLTALARRAWAAVEGVGYARVDLRVDRQGRLFVIDVNPNPDLAPGAGLARQAAAAGWGYADLVAKILELAVATQDPRARRRGARGAGV